MRFVEVICFSVILVLFSSAFTGVYSQLLKMDSRLEQIQKKTESLIFISESFCNTCRGKGFSSFDEWETGCASLWKLESIEWECIEGKSVGQNVVLYCGRWSGPYGNGVVYGTKAKK